MTTIRKHFDHTKETLSRLTTFPVNLQDVVRRYPRFRACFRKQVLDKQAAWLDIEVPAGFYEALACWISIARDQNPAPGMRALFADPALNAVASEFEHCLGGSTRYIQSRWIPVEKIDGYASDKNFEKMKPAFRIRYELCLGSERLRILFRIAFHVNTTKTIEYEEKVILRAYTGKPPSETFTMYQTLNPGETHVIDADSAFSEANLTIAKETMDNIMKARQAQWDELRKPLPMGESSTTASDDEKTGVAAVAAAAAAESGTPSAATAAAVAATTAEEEVKLEPDDKYSNARWVETKVNPKKGTIVYHAKVKWHLAEHVLSFAPTQSASSITHELHACFMDAIPLLLSEYCAAKLVQCEKALWTSIGRTEIENEIQRLRTHRKKRKILLEYIDEEKIRRTMMREMLALHDEYWDRIPS